jgi:hypothetical protein
MDRLEKVKKELNLIRDFMDKQEEDIETLKHLKKKKDKEAALIEDTIGPLQLQLEKINIINSKY